MLRHCLWFVLAVGCSPVSAVKDAGDSTLDSGAADSGAPDAGASDAGAPDAGAPDAGASDAGSVDAGTVDWPLTVDPAQPAEAVTPALLGHYDLSGALYDYPSNAALKAKLGAIGFSEWRVGVGRWEVATRLLPTRTDGSSCASVIGSMPPGLKAPAGATDLTLLANRDWFTDTGAGVTLADTNDDSRYSLAYVRSVIDAAHALGASPFVDLDLMPRALARNRTFSRVGTIVGLSDPCLGSFSNGVSNSPPANPDVFAAAARGLVRRVVEGSGAEPGRDAPYWEVWNEEELGYAWAGSSDDYFQMTLRVLLELDGWRKASTLPKVQALKFGFGSFAKAGTAAVALTQLDTLPLPNGSFTPFDFLSFHGYENDPLVLLGQVKAVSDARAASTHYRNVELVLSEWGPNLDASPPSDTIAQALLVSTVLARLPVLGVGRTHRSLFFDFVPGFIVPFAPLQNDGTPKPLYHAYELLHGLVGVGGQRLPVAGSPDGAFANGLGAALVIKPATGGIRAMVVNRDTAAHFTRLQLGTGPALPSRVRVFDQPSMPPRDVAPSLSITVPAQSIVLIEQ